jgi:hypothetical protein
VKKKQPKLTFAPKLDIVVPEQESAYIVLKSDWKRLRKRVERIKTSNPIVFSMATTALGLGIFNVIAGKWVVYVPSFIVCGFLMAIYYKYQRSQEAYSRQDAIDCLDEIEGKFPKHTETEPPNTMPARKENG